MSVPTIAGLFPILATPFDSSGALDIGSLRRLVEFQLHSGVDGMAVFGMASEGFALTSEERGLILRTVRDVTAGAVPVVAGLSATSTATALEQGLTAMDEGADALMVLPPFMVKPSADQLVDFYGAIAAKTRTHVMVQDAPGTTGVSMGLPLIAQLSRLDGVQSIKIEAPPTAPKIAGVLQTAPAEFVILGGQNSQMLLLELEAGAVGTMPACEFSDLLRPVLRAWYANDRETAQESFTRLLPLILFGLQPGLAWAVHKEVLVMRGLIDTAVVRSPAKTIDSTLRDALAKIVTKSGLSTIGAAR